MRSGTLKITRLDLAGLIDGVWYTWREQLREFPFFALEQDAAQKLLLLTAREAGIQGEASKGKHQDAEAVDAQLREITQGVTVSEDEIAAYYGQVKDTTGIPLSRVRDSIRKAIEQEKHDAAIDEYLRTLGKRIDIIVSAEWVREQAKLSGENPISKARSSNRPSLVAFSSGSCCGSDRTGPMLDELRAAYGDKLNIVHVDARHHPLLLARHSIRSVPTYILYDRNGEESSRQRGLLDVARLRELAGVPD